MFNLSTQDVVSSIEKTPLVNLDGIIFQEYNNFFGKKIILPDLHDKSFLQLEMQENNNRVRLDYQDDLLKKIRIFFMQTKITDALSKKFKINLKFESVDIWIDKQGYNLSPHTDDTRVKLALQIYLGNNNLGTSLYVNNENIKTFEFKFGSGYALLNNDRSFHGLDTAVEKSGRTSLYARYS